MEEFSPLQKARRAYVPSIPPLLLDLSHVRFQPIAGGPRPREELRKLFPKTFDQPAYQLIQAKGVPLQALRVGAVFSGGQAAGGHNVLAGLFDALKAFSADSRLLGFLNGPSGIVQNEGKELSKKEIDLYRNQGGFDLLGSGRTKIETKEQLEASWKTCEEKRLDGLVIIGGDDSNTNAAVLAEFFREKGSQTKVVGIPKTIDGDLRSADVELSFGFDSACKTYAESIGNIAKDALSAKKYYHFIKLMGRSASHVTLECALATHPNLALIAEEGKSLDEIVHQIADLICRRFEEKKEYGVFLIPEGLIEFLPEMKRLIAELNHLLAKGEAEPQLLVHLSPSSKELFHKLPPAIQKQLLLERDPHGNVQVSPIETEVLLIDLVKSELKKRPSYRGKFAAQEHFLGYEGRACFPSNFDANYCYTLGKSAALALRDGLTGVICAVKHLKQSPKKWEVRAIPLVRLMHLEMRSGKEKPVIQKFLVDTKTEPFLYFARIRKSWELVDLYRYPGPIQFFGEKGVTEVVPFTLR